MIYREMDDLLPTIRSAFENPFEENVDAILNQTDQH